MGLGFCVDATEADIPLDETCGYVKASRVDFNASKDEPSPQWVYARLAGKVSCGRESAVRRKLKISIICFIFITKSGFKNCVHVRS